MLLSPLAHCLQELPRAAVMYIRCNSKTGTLIKHNIVHNDEGRMDRRKNSYHFNSPWQQAANLEKTNHVARIQTVSLRAKNGVLYNGDAKVDGCSSGVGKHAKSVSPRLLLSATVLEADQRLCLTPSALYIAEHCVEADYQHRHG
jgi:hypothetical protein